MNEKNNIRSPLILVAALLFLSPLCLHLDARQDISLPVTRFRLDNGLEVILSEDRSLPVVSVVVAYRVGSLYEKPGKSGLAYLLQNLMFQGSRNIGRMQHIRFIQKIGGRLNAVTQEDRTFFYQTVPSNQLALVLWLESDRMITLNITPSVVEDAKNSLIEEIRLRNDTDPYRESSLRLDRLLFPDFAYHHPVVGSIADIKNIKLEDVKAFYSAYYTPNNAVLSIAGHLEEDKVRRLVRRYFASIPRGKDPPPPSLGPSEAVEPASLSLELPLAPDPGFHLGYPVAPPGSDDFYPLLIAEYILLKGRSSRLYKRLLKKDRTAVSVSGGIQAKGDLAAFKLFVRTANRYTRSLSQKSLFAEIERLKSSLVSDEELAKAKNLFKRDYFHRFATSLDRAIFLVEESAFRRGGLDWKQEIERFLAVNRYEVSRMANKYFGPRRVLIDIETK